ncbi:ubiquitin carboxyl-terminal hydrolase CYLD isoform X3 [Lucilia sericata]|uniref:ubiquitin carboxyl-terminal hydrolase CYLD isoform X3 n=1 Tax=Lucilia sericata TaxID=13632 RepID=UPI0018A84ED0|nr:ubiquitin carboxyl-terminal hydrolase CYLD isoform X3 [Lucilia sericata]
MEVNTISKYAVLMRSTKVRLHQSPDIPIADDAKEAENEISINAGALIKIFQSKTPTSSGQGSKNLTSTIQVLDLINHMPIYENLYECPQANLRRVDENLWPFIISIVDPEQRLRMLQDECRCKWVVYLDKNEFVSVAGEMFNKPGTNFDCIIRYIGPVMELHSVGYFFGLEILDLSSGYSPQADKVQFAHTYMGCDPTLSIFTTANWITPIPKEQQKKFSARDLINGTIEKFKSAIGPSSSLTGIVGSNTSSLKRDKKAKKPKPSAQFYDKVEDTTDSCVYNNNNDNNNKMERSKKESSNVMSLSSEEFKQSIENREKSLERRATTTNTVQTQTQPQSGILKNKHKDQTKSTAASGPEIVVIDNADIDESKRQEVIVIDKERHEHVDLMEILGSDWPTTAGDAAAILNKQKLQNANTSGSAGVVSTAGNNIVTSSKSNRNKSSNPLTHLAGNNAKKTNDSISPNNKNVDNKKIQNSAYDQPEFLPAVLDSSDFMQVTSLQEVPSTDLGLGSMVEVNVPESNEHLYGVIRWIGIPPGNNNILIGVELEDDCIDKQLITTDGGFNGIPLFKCPVGRGIFVNSDQCSIDRRFLGADGGAIGNGISEANDNKTKTTNGFHNEEQTFGHMDCPIVSGAVAPIKCSSLNGLEELCGKFKGIQGHHNSCYLDVTLFSMFAFTPVFDAILYRPPEKDDILHYTEVQTVLREEIVNPLRKHMFVRADRVMKLRQLLDKLSSVSGLTSEEKDPEEFLNCLLSQIMRAEPFLKLNSGQDAYYYQLFVEKDERLSFPSVQQLFEQSFYSSDIKLKEVPSCLIIQMPRFGKSFKMYPRILPSQVLDVTDIIDDSPRQCSVCGKLAEFECRDCFGVLQNGIGLESTSFCPKCLETVHMHAKRSNHKHRKLSVPQDFRVMAEHMNVPRLYMELFAVVCIETSHYVTFVKAGSGPDAPWCFFDSMADRKGEQNGYNIPKMITVPDLPQWLSEDGARTVNETSSNDKMLPEHAKRLFCDAYMCMYQSTDVMMYR